MKKYYISEFSNKGNNAGTKARNDIEYIFNKEGLERVNNFTIESKIESKSIFYYVKNYINAFRLYMKVKNIEEGIIFYQYPILKRVITEKAINKKKKNVKFCFLIHDLNSLRSDKSKREELIKDEISLLNKAEVVITHNKTMSKVLKENGLKSNIIELEIFDYINDKYENEIHRYKKNQIVYAGNLKAGKNSFLNYLIEDKNIDFNLNLYGPNFDKSKVSNDRIEYKGNFKPDEVISKLEGSFGLIWDGDSIEKCSGIYGEYLRYNNPHKLSMYIASKLPVIVWEESAIAELVISKKIGFTIKSLDEIGNKIRNMTNDEYEQYIENISKIRKEISKGIYTKNCLEKAVRLL